MAFGESTISRTQVQLWYNGFKEGQEYINDDIGPGHPSSSTTDENIEAVKKMIFGDVVDDVGISFGLCKAIFTDLKDETCCSKYCSKIAKF